MLQTIYSIKSSQNRCCLELVFHPEGGRALITYKPSAFYTNGREIQGVFTLNSEQRAILRHQLSDEVWDKPSQGCCMPECSKVAVYGIYPSQPYQETYACAEHVSVLADDDDVVDILVVPGLVD